MARARHATRVHPLRSKGVVVGVPVAAAVAFGAHSVLGVTPLSEQQDAPSAASAVPSAAPVQSYGLAPTPPPTTLDLLSAPGEHTTDAGSAPSTGAASTAAPTSSASSTARSTTTRIVADRTPAGPAQTVPIAAPARAAAAPAPSMMTFSGGEAPQQAPAASQQQAPQQQAQASQQQASQQQASQQQAPQQQADESDGGSQQSSGGSLLGVDLGVAKVSVLSFGQ